jgi:hypothetical protein
MADRARNSYPSVGDPDRLDAIVRRGRSLQRRRQLTVAGAGTGGALAVVLVAVLALGGGSGNDEQLVADDDRPTDPTETTTTTPPSAPELTLRLEAGPPASIQVEDPDQPVGEGTQQCLTVTAYPAGTVPGDESLPLAEGTACAPGLSENGEAELTLAPTTDSGADSGADLGTGPTEIGCAASIERPAPEAVASTETRRGVTKFSLSAPDLAPGPYRVSVSAASGVGDGCAPEQAGVERENTVEATGTITLP